MRVDFASDNGLFAMRIVFDKNVVDLRNLQKAGLSPKYVSMDGDSISLWFGGKW